MGADNIIVNAGAGKRSHRRSRVLLSAMLCGDSGDIPVRLRDLSRSGALVEHPEPLAVGSQVVFHRGATMVPARVAWAGPGRMGLEFLRAIEENEVLVHVGRRAPAPVEPRAAAPPRAVETDLTEEQRKLAKLWSLRVGIRMPKP